MVRLRRAFLSLAIAGALLTPAASQPATAARSILLVNGHIFDGLGSPPIRNGSVLIRGGRIERVAAGRLRPPPGAQVLNLRGAWVLPGLIDAHAHLRDLDSARRAVRAGITTVRSMGVEHFFDVSIAKLHAEGAAYLPDVVAAGYHVRRRPAAALFKDAPELATIDGTVAGADSMRKLVRLMAGRGAKVIKVMATERAGTPDTDFRRRMLNDAEIQAVVGEAAKAGLPVAAHAHSDEGARAAVLAGAQSIEHGTLIRAPTFKIMRDQRVCFVPTLSFWADMAIPGGEYDHPLLAKRASRMLPEARRSVALASQLGVPMAAGSDMRYDRTSPFTLADEAREMARSGLGPRRAIIAATSGAAACLGIAGRTGAIRRGLDADVIVIGHNPIASLRALKDVRLVINDGAIAVNRLEP